MLGSIIGDISGSTYEFTGNKDVNAPLFPDGSCYTDDTVMVVATADAILTQGSFSEIYLKYGRRFERPMGGYGARFAGWIRSGGPKPYGSWGNGAAMRVAPVGWIHDSLKETTRIAQESAMVTHDHPEGIKGAVAVAGVIFMARMGADKNSIRRYATEVHGYDLDRTCDSIRPSYVFSESSQDTVPQALIAFLDSSDFADSIRLAISLGGDADTLACITGGIAHAYYKKIPRHMVSVARRLLEPSLMRVLDEFCERFSLPS